jgi:N4-gp56 family major capsid protein
MSNTNTTINTQPTNAYFNKTFYDKKLLEIAKTKFVHAMFGQKRPIPRNGGKRIEFRKFNLFDPNPNLLTLVEGVTPTGQSLTQTKLEAEVAQYGAYVELSDLLDMTAYDDVKDASVELLGEQLGTCVEWVTRDAMCATTSVQYANGRADRASITSSDKLTVDEIRKAVRTLKKNKARMFTNGYDGSVRRPHFVCIVSPDSTYDLQNDSLWQDVSKYSNAEQIYSGEIGRLFGVVFVESTEAKVFRQSVLNKTRQSANQSTSILPLRDTPTDEALAYLNTAGNKLMVGSNEVTIVSFNATTNTVTVSESITYSLNAIVYSNDAGAVDSTTKQGIDVHATLVFGADAYGMIDIDGSGSVETIFKPQGSEGTGDPLNQRATIGAKVAAYAAKVLQPLWIIRIEHAVSA